MGFASIFKGFARTAAPEAAPASDQVYSTSDVETDVLDWCASDDRWIAVRSTAALLAENEDLIGCIKLCYGVPRAEFDRDILSLIIRYADFVGDLPCTQNNFFARPGGLFRAGLEIGFRCLQGADAHVVANVAANSQRRELEPRWRRATFIAGLCSQLHRALTHVAVVDNNTDTWPAYTAGLNPWLRSRRAKHFMPQWTDVPQETRGLSVIALGHVVPHDMLQYLAQGNSVVVPHLFAALSGLPLSRDPILLHDLLKRSTALVVDRDLRACERRTGRSLLGAHLERHMLDAMRRLVATNPMWQPNQERSRVWFGEEGLFVVWPNSAAEVRRILEADDMPGVPTTPEAIAKVLTDGGVLQLNGASTTWTISPPPGKGQFEAIRFASADVLLSGLNERPAPIAEKLLVPQASSAHVTTEVVNSTSMTPLPGLSAQSTAA